MKRLLFLFHICLFSLSLFSESGSSDPFRVAAVGDSITWGFGLEKRYENSWPAVVESLSGGRFETGNFGRNGATLTDLGDRPYKDTAQYSRALEFNADVVVIALGTNDTKIGNRIFLDSFKEDYLELIGAFRQENEPRDIYLCLPPPVFHNRWGMEGSLLDKCLIPLIREIAEESGCQVIDLHYPLLDHQEYFADGVHPDGRGARMIGELIFKQIMN